MELKEKITLDMLTKDSVSVLRQQFLTFTVKKCRSAETSATHT